MQEKGPELLTIHSSVEAEMPFRWSAGRFASRFLVEMRDHKKFYGVRCPKCNMVYVPPKEICDPCYTRMSEPVEVGPLGTIRSFTILRFAFVDPLTGMARPVPYAYGNIQLDGADTVLPHFIEYEDESQVQVGARVEAVFEEERTGKFVDLKTFRVIG